MFQFLFITYFQLMIDLHTNDYLTSTDLSDFIQCIRISNSYEKLDNNFRFVSQSPILLTFFFFFFYLNLRVTDYDLEILY